MRAFFQYHQALYSSRVDYTPIELDTYQDKVAFPTLDPEVNAGLESDLTLGGDTDCSFAMPDWEDSRDG